VGLGVKNHLDYPLCYTENSLKATAIAALTPKHRHKTVERKPTNVRVKSSSDGSTTKIATFRNYTKLPLRRTMIFRDRKSKTRLNIQRSVCQRPLHRFEPIQYCLQQCWKSLKCSLLSKQLQLFNKIATKSFETKVKTIPAQAIGSQEVETPRQWQLYALAAFTPTLFLLEVESTPRVTVQSEGLCPDHRE